MECFNAITELSSKLSHGFEKLTIYNIILKIFYNSVLDWTEMQSILWGIEESISLRKNGNKLI